MTRNHPVLTTHCTDCLHDPTMAYPRDPDAVCLICQARLCAAHIAPHLASVHCCSITLNHYRACPPEPPAFTA